MKRSYRFIGKIFIVSLLSCTGILLTNTASVAAALQFNQTLSLTAGFPGDLPDNTRVAYNSRHSEYLVVYQYHNSILPGPDQIHAARLSASGQYLANYFISDLPNDCIQPDVAYDPLFDRYLVVWSYDTLNDGSGYGWDIYGRFVPWSGPTATLPSFEVAAGEDEYTGTGIRFAVDEKNPRIAYGSQNRSFFIVMEAVPIIITSKPYITGTKVQVSGANLWQNLTIRVDTSTAIAHPDVAYDNLQDEFLVVFDNLTSIYGLFVAGQETVGVHQTIQNLGTLLSEVTPGTPLAGTHERPAVAFSGTVNFYLITWVTNRHIDAGDLWVRYSPGSSAPPQLVVHLEQLDTGDPVNLADVDCGANAKPPLLGVSGADCLVTWTVRHASTFWVFGRQISLLSNSNGSLLDHATSYFGPLANVGLESTWTTDEPQIGVASGSDNFCPVFTGFDNYSIKRAFSNMSAYTPAEGWSSAAAGGSHSLGIRSDGSLWAWGDNNRGQLGLGDNTSRNTPTRVGSFTDWVMVSAGETHSLGVRADGSLYGWGFNFHNALGLGDSVDRNTPERIGSFNNWIAVSAGLSDSLGILADGSLWAWGNNESGQLGLGDLTDRSVPTRVGTFNDWITVDTSIWDHSLGIRAFEDGALYAWGGNFTGQLGLGDDGSGTGRNIPTRIDTNHWDVTSAGGSYSLAIRSDDSLWAWGNNSLGQLGLGDLAMRNIPNRVGTWNDWVTVEAGITHTLGIRSDSTLWAWGNNNTGQLGLGNTTIKNTPTQVGSSTDWVAVSAGIDHSLGVRSDGTLWAWGGNSNGQLGVGDNTDRNAPTQVIIRPSLPWPMFLPAIIYGRTH